MRDGLLVLAVCGLALALLVVMRWRRVPILSSLVHGLAHLMIHEDGSIEIVSGSGHELQVARRIASAAARILPHTRFGLISRHGTCYLLFFDQDPAANARAIGTLRRECPTATWAEIDQQTARGSFGPFSFLRRLWSPG